MTLKEVREEKKGKGSAFFESRIQGVLDVLDGYAIGSCLGRRLQLPASDSNPEYPCSNPPSTFPLSTTPKGWWPERRCFLFAEGMSPEAVHWN